MTMTDKNVLNNYPETCAEYDLVVAQIRELFLKKQGDYGPNNISMGGDLELAKIAIVIRINDKVQRLLNLLKSDATPNNEPIEDSFMDLANYGIMAMILLRGKWGK
jgi:hypothetical protein